MQTDQHFDFCLLIPCFNNFQGLVHSIRSVNYEPEKFIVLVVDDGSKDPVHESALKNEFNISINIVVLRNHYNLGITYTLNRGLAFIENNIDTAFIARLDCGDTCHPDRFKKQITWMRDNPSTALLGSWCYFNDSETSGRYMYKTPLVPEEIRREMYARNVFIHPTVIYRRSVLREVGLYPGNFPHAEDYAFFWKIMQQHPVALIGECLVTCEISKTGISYRNKSKQLRARWRVVNTFGSNLALKFLACARLVVLYVLPRKLTLQFKKWRTPACNVL